METGWLNLQRRRGESELEKMENRERKKKEEREINRENEKIK
jgi:hypothetical protein